MKMRMVLKMDREKIFKENKESNENKDIVCSLKISEYNLGSGQCCSPDRRRGGAGWKITGNSGKSDILGLNTIFNERPVYK